jgi:hypothetical protein
LAACGRILTLNASEENRRRLACWEPEIAPDQWHGRTRGAFKQDGRVPITIDIQNPCG